MTARLAVVNPAAGRGPGARLRVRARRELARLLPGIEFVETGRPGHATELAQGVSGGLLVAVGGDGTVREVAAGLAGRADAPELALVPVGSGNDLARNLGIPQETAAACRVAVEGRPRAIDAARVISEGRETLFVNAAGFGFDARVIQEARRLRHLRGLPLYVGAVMLAVRSFGCPRVRLAVDGETREESVLLVAAANGRCYGGGMKVAPGAEPDDGRLEVCVIRACGRARIMSCLPRLVRGTHGGMPEVSFLSGATVELEFAAPVPVQLDGDLLDWPGARRFRLEVLPGAVRVRVPGSR